jgi:two-component system, cell cycle sensor histidine kinase and response regulator CckA
MATPDGIRLLLIEDNEDDAILVVNWLRRGGIEMSSQRVDTAKEMAEALRSGHIDLVISDCKMPLFDPVEALELLRDSGLDIPLLIVSGQIGEAAAADLMRAGARDFVLKDDLARLVPAVERELREAAERRKRKDLERQLHQAERLDTLGQLAGGIAHDFNNLLGVIHGCADFVLDELTAGHPCRADVENIYQAAVQAASLTRQLLIFSRLQPSQPESLDINTVVTETGRLLRRLLGEDIEFSTVLQPDIGRVTIDRGRLEQVIMNAAVNARAAMPAGGRLVIETAAAGPAELADADPDLGPGPFLRLSCTDTGCGMSAETAQRAFEPFFTTKNSGTGLGLATVYGAVKDAGGAVTLRSRPGAGTTINVYLPVAERTTETSAHAGDHVPRGRGEQVLLVEDNDAVRTVAQRILAAGGYQVLPAASRQQALDICADAATRLDLLLTDVVMPGLAIRDFIALVRMSRPGLPILLMSGYAADQIADGDPLPPMVAKPFDSPTLLRHVRKTLTD